jgi:uncharacterized protein
MTSNFTAFHGQRRLASGPLPEVALAVRRAEGKANEAILIFSDATGRAIDLDVRGKDEEVLARLPETAEANPVPEPAPPDEPRGRGRPKLGVVAREVTLLPRHWQWLSSQPGGASVAIRQLVETARRANQESDQRRLRQEAAYHFMSAMAGNLANFEEASGALFADDTARFRSLIVDWPPDVREHAVKLAFGGSRGE